MKTTDDADKTAAGIEAKLKIQQAEEDALLAAGWEKELALLTKLMCWCFAAPGVLRSTAYQDGARQLFLEKLDIKPRSNPFEPGTAQADAWQGGVALAMTAHMFHLSQGLPE